jgi:recombination protein RecR
MTGPSRYLEALVKEFSRLPGVGPKSASRLAFHILKMSPEEVERLSRALLELKSNITSCSVCGGIADDSVCTLCSDETRDQGMICVVGEQKDVLTIERTGEFKGLYHVLGGVISPLDGIGPGELNIRTLLQRCGGGAVREVILATNATVEGDATSLYLAKILKPLGVMVMRIAHGLPVGSDLEFADSATLAQSLQGRVAM